MRNKILSGLVLSFIGISPLFAQTTSCDGMVSNMVATPRPDGTRCTITWTDPACVTSSQIGYKVKGTVTWKHKMISNDVNTATLINLQPGTEYIYKIWTKVNGTIVYKGPQRTFVTPACQLPKPHSLEGYAELMNNDIQAHLFWAIDSNVMCLPKEYVLRYRPVNTYDSTPAPWTIITKPWNTHHLLMNLASNTTYEWTVKSKDLGNSSAFAPSTYFTTPNDPCANFMVYASGYNSDSASCTGSAYAYVPGIYSGLTYIWMFPDGNTETTTGSQIGGLCPGQYTVIVADSTCEGVGHFFVGINQGTDSLSQYNAHERKAASTKTVAVNNISVGPNPFNNSLMVKLGEETTAKITIVNILGESVLSNIRVNSSYSVNTENFEKGVYFYTVTSNTGTILSAGKIIKQ